MNGIVLPGTLLNKMCLSRTQVYFHLPNLLLVAALLASCAAPPAAQKPAAPVPSATSVAAPTASLATPAQTPKTAGEQPKYGGYVTRSNSADPPSLDIHQESTVASLLSLANVYNGLVRFDAVDVDKVIPDLAEKWEASPDGKAYTFKLRDGVGWHDGTPLTVDDVKSSLERMAFWKEHKIVSPRGGSLLSVVKSVETPDKSTVRINLKNTSEPFMRNLASGWVLILPQHVIQAKGDMKKDVLGSGAFKWKSQSPGVSIELVKNDKFFRKGLPYLDGIRIFTIKDEATRFAAFRTGQVKMTMTGSQALTHPQAEIVKRMLADKTTVITYGGNMRYMLFTNIKKAPYNDVRVRRAIDLAFDRQAAIKVNSGMGMIGSALSPTGMWGIDEKDMTKRQGYRQPKDADIEQAVKLLSEAGYPGGFKAQLLVRGGGIGEYMGVVCKEQLAKIGVQATMEVMDSANQNARLNRHDFEMSFNARSEPLDDPDVFAGYYITNGASNFGEFSDSKIDELFEKQSSILDSGERKKVVLDIQESILETAPLSIVFWDMYNLGHWNDVKGYKMGGSSFGYNNLDHAWLAQ